MSLMSLGNLLGLSLRRDGKTRNLSDGDPILTIVTCMVGSSKITLLHIFTELFYCIRAVLLPVFVDVNLHGESG